MNLNNYFASELKCGHLSFNSYMKSKKYVIDNTSSKCISNMIKNQYKITPHVRSRRRFYDNVTHIIRSYKCQFDSFNFIRSGYKCNKNHLNSPSVCSRSLGSLIKSKYFYTIIRNYSSAKSNLQPVRGMYDSYGLEQDKNEYVISIAKSICLTYGFVQIETPLVESESLFSKTLGVNSDVVSKEMYTFVDKSNNKLALRPEGTAGVVRAVMNNPQIHNKLFYHGPMFRYEKPQRGRNRQFYQFGIEHLGDESELSDVQAIEMLWILFEKLKIADTNLIINSLGDKESREIYRKVLEDYFTKYEPDLSSTSKLRLNRGSVLRILDSKEKEDQKIIEDAPQIMEYLSDSSKSRFEKVQIYLNILKIPYSLDSKLVRGLDYYNDTCFEFVKNGSALAAGGRYDNLMKILGGPKISGVGWAAGIERIALSLPSFTPSPPIMVAVIPISDSPQSIMDEIREAAFKIASKLRRVGISVYFSNELTRSSKILKKVNKELCKIAIFVGSEEINNQLVSIKDLSTGKQRKVDLNEWIDEYLKSSTK